MNKFILVFLSSLLVLSGCMKDTIDPPANPQNPADIIPNYTIGLLKADFKASGSKLYEIIEDRVIAATVIANDKSGNLYKEIFIQDIGATIGVSAISVKINRSNLYNDFPVGRRIYIKLKGMAVQNDNNLIVLGGYIDTVTTPNVRSLGYINATAIDKTVIKGSLNNTYNIEEFATLDEMFNMYQISPDLFQSNLIRLSNVEFDCDQLNSTYADAINLSDANRILLDNKGKKIIVRNSGYSSFAGTKLPSGKGTLVGLLTVYRNDYQLIIRDLEDVKLSDPARTKPCAGSGGGVGGTATLATIASIRAMFTGNGAKIVDKYIEGVVISDKDGKNINSQNLVIQDATGGLILRFSTPNTYALGEKLKVTFAGDSLTKFSGAMQIFIPTSRVTQMGTGTITPAALTIATINGNIDAYESTLVTIANATFPSGTYNGSKTLTDASGTITHYTAPTATFTGATMPSGPKSVTGIVGRFNSTKQFSIRNLSDIQ